MLEYTDNIRNIAKRLLEHKIVDTVVGFRAGTVPMVNEPCYITSPNEVKLLVWDSNCRINLVNYITDRDEKIAILVKGCDSRNVLIHISENKINREKIYIVGVPCNGMIDKSKIESFCKNEIIKVSEVDNKVIIKTKEKSSIILDKKNVLQENCRFCLYPNPVISDEMVGSFIKNENTNDRYADIKKIEKISFEDRWNYFEVLFSNCIRCYACRNACPLCYCPVCFVDESNPQWLGKGQNSVDIKIFHFLRAYHCAGRCTDCGACEQACPVNINMRILTKKLEKDCNNLFGFHAGLSLEAKSALETYDPNDPNEFIK